MPLLDMRGLFFAQNLENYTKLLFQGEPENRIFDVKTAIKPFDDFSSEAGMETYLTIEELAEYLKLAEQTIRRWVLNREIPYHKIKKVIRFRISEIEKWIDEGGYILPDEPQASVEGGLFDDAISLDELAEMEQAEEQPEDVE